MKQRLIASTLALLIASGTVAQQPNVNRAWQDPNLNAVNRLPMHTNYFAYENKSLAESRDKEQSENYLSLDGLWRFNWVKDADMRPTDFWQEEYNDQGWAEMPVPGMWEMNGYGDPMY